jgi:hypothetical protein
VGKPSPLALPWVAPRAHNLLRHNAPIQLPSSTFLAEEHHGHFVLAVGGTPIPVVYMGWGMWSLRPCCSLQQKRAEESNRGTGAGEAAGGGGREAAFVSLCWGPGIPTNTNTESLPRSNYRGVLGASWSQPSIAWLRRRCELFVLCWPATGAAANAKCNSAA